jgi:hypothetical protein
MEDELVASGRFVRIETLGRRSSRLRAVTVGFVGRRTVLRAPYSSLPVRLTALGAQPVRRTALPGQDR